MPEENKKPKNTTFGFLVEPAVMFAVTVYCWHVDNMSTFRSPLLVFFIRRLKLIFYDDEVVLLFSNRSFVSREIYFAFSSVVLKVFSLLYVCSAQRRPRASSDLRRSRERTGSFFKSTHHVKEKNNWGPFSGGSVWVGGKTGQSLRWSACSQHSEKLYGLPQITHRSRTAGCWRSISCGEAVEEPQQ